MIAALSFFIFKIRVHSIFLLVELALISLRYERRDELACFPFGLFSLFHYILFYLLIGSFMFIFAHYNQLTQLSFIDYLRILAKLTVIMKLKLTHGHVCINQIIIFLFVLLILLLLIFCNFLNHLQSTRTSLRLIDCQLTEQLSELLKFLPHRLCYLIVQENSLQVLVGDVHDKS